MIASSPHGRASAAGRGHLSIDTSGVSGKDPGLYSSGDSPTTLAPVSAPVAGSAAPHVFEHQRPQRFVDEAPAKGGDDERTTRSQDTADLDEKSSPLLTSPGAMGSRSFRARSKLAGVGIRRASTYVWGRSSVFIRALSSTDELPGNGALAPSQQPLPQPLPPQPAPGAWESDMDTGSTKTEDTSSHSGPAVPAAAAAAAASAPAQQESTASPASQPAASARRFAKSPAAMRLHAARELVMTEKNFVDNLFVIKKVWMEPVFSSANSLKPIIPYQTARIVFFGIAALHAHASHFYREMDFTLGSYERGSGPVEGWADDGMRIGALFRGSSRHWSDFIAYVRNYGAAVNCLKHLEDYKPYQRYHEECMLQKRTNRQSLKDLLMLPIQRITRYTLLLKNILKHTPAVHSDHIDICRAVKNVTHFATIVNECRRKQEEVQRTIEVLRSIDVCPPFPHIETRAFVAEFYVRELISRLPTRLLLFSDMLVVAQGPAQAITSGSSSGAGAGSSIDVDVEWTYYGSASLDEVEVQNADESTSTLITILSLNRNAASADTLGSSRRSLLPGTEPPTNTSSTSDLRGLAHPGSQGCGSDAGELGDSRARSSGGPQGSGPYMPATQSLADVSSADPVGRKKKSKSRRGLLHSGSRESIPDHIAALSHSTFPSPVPPPTHLDHSQLRLCGTASDRESHTPQPQPQRPKTAAGSHSGVPSITHAHSALALHNSSNSTIGSHGGSLHPIDLATPLPGSASSVSAGRADIASPKPIQLTLVMQHATSAARKQFVRALKDATAIFINEALGFGDSDVASSHRLEDSSSEVLNLHPL
ncbi:hypothetical protein GGF46_003023 [Coemansia sp. RSA 552]|nr:hypothetical protein GGF46_003023 [Coemansia sp. RSA 552]